MAKSYLKKAFEIDLNWRMAALEDEDLKPLWESFESANAFKRFHMTYSFLGIFGARFYAGIAVDVLQCFPANCL